MRELLRDLCVIAGGVLVFVTLWRLGLLWLVLLGTAVALALVVMLHDTEDEAEP